MKFLFYSVPRLLLSGFMVGLLFGLLGLLLVQATLPSVEVLKDARLQVPLKVYSSDHKLLAEYGSKRRIPVKLEDVPKDLINAVLATEDRRFFEHPGVDLRSLGRALFSTILHGSLVQGGSTITMQVARNFFLTRNKTFLRKISEMLLAFKIEQKLTKKEILELYLNKIYFGKQAYGIAAAAEVYYGKTIQLLTLSQMAMLAGLPQAPSVINPLYSPKAALKRRKHVLDSMLDSQFITKAQYEAAVRAPLGAKYHARRIEVDGSYIGEMVRQILVAQFGEDNAYENGYEVYTTVNSQLQLAANRALRRAILEYDQRHSYRKPTHITLPKYKNAAEMVEGWKQYLRNIPTSGDIIPAIVTAVENHQIRVLLQTGEFVHLPVSQFKWKRLQENLREFLHVQDLVYVQPTPSRQWQLVQIPEVGGAFVALDPQTGNVLALVGGFDHQRSPFNRVIQADRQPGSNFKPFIYSAALSEGFTLASLMDDSPLIQEATQGQREWRPQNYTKEFYGPTRLRVGLTHSRNIVSIRLLQTIGIDTGIQYAKRFGFAPNKLPHGLSLALGSGSATPLELVTAYAAFANGGYSVKPQLIQTIKNEKGEVIYEMPPLESQEKTQAISTEVAYLITTALQDAIQSGTGKRAKSLNRRDLAGKTATTNEYKDTWYTGYNADIVATAWMGYDDPKSIGEYSAQATLPMWIYFMEAALKDKPEHTPPQPPGIVNARIDPETGLLAYPGQRDAIYEFFTEGSVPKEVAPKSSHSGKSSNIPEATEQTEALF